MDSFILVWAWMGLMIAVLFFVYSLTLVGEAWKRIKEYEEMKSKGYSLMKSDKGDDFWVGYGD